MKIAIHPPCHPHQQQPAGKDQSDDLHQLRHQQRKDDPQDQRRGNADGNHLLALVGRQSRSERTHDNGVVAGQNRIDQHDLHQDRKRARLKEIGKFHGAELGMRRGFRQS